LYGIFSVLLFRFSYQVENLIGGVSLEGVAQFANYRNQSLLVGQPKNSIKSTKLINYKLKRISGKVGSFSIFSLHSQLLWVFLRFFFLPWFRVHNLRVELTANISITLRHTQNFFFTPSLSQKQFQLSLVLAEYSFLVGGFVSRRN